MICSSCIHVRFWPFCNVRVFALSAGLPRRHQIGERHADQLELGSPDRLCQLQTSHPTWGTACVSVPWSIGPTVCLTVSLQLISYCKNSAFVWVGNWAAIIFRHETSQPVIWKALGCGCVWWGGGGGGGNVKVCKHLLQWNSWKQKQEHLTHGFMSEWDRNSYFVKSHLSLKTFFFFFFKLALCISLYCWKQQNNKEEKKKGLKITPLFWDHIFWNLTCHVSMYCKKNKTKKPTHTPEKRERKKQKQNNNKKNLTKDNQFKPFFWNRTFNVSTSLNPWPRIVHLLKMTCLCVRACFCVINSIYIFMSVFTRPRSTPLLREYFHLVLVLNEGFWLIDWWSLI